jgi:hypothetical protein
LGHFLALYVTHAKQQDRAHMEELARQDQEVTDQSVEVAFVDQGCTLLPSCSARATKSARNDMAYISFQSMAGSPSMPIY